MPNQMTRIELQIIENVDGNIWLLSGTIALFLASRGFSVEIEDKGDALIEGFSPDPGVKLRGSIKMVVE